MINHRHRCIYVHIPKTAGNSVNRVFGVDWEDHKDLAQYAREVSAEVFATYFKFAIVRNPWDRLFSDYNYQRKKSRSNKLALENDQGEQRTFSQWVRAALANPQLCDPACWGGAVSPWLHRWSPQVDWITVNGENRLDCVLRMEHLQKDFSAVCRRLNLPVTRLPRRNRRLHCHYSWYYDDVTREFVGHYYERDIATFGYRFERSTANQAWTRARELKAVLVNGIRAPAGIPSLRAR